MPEYRHNISECRCNVPEYYRNVPEYYCNVLECYYNMSEYYCNMPECYLKMPECRWKMALNDVESFHLNVERGLVHDEDVARLGTAGGTNDLGFLQLIH